MSIFKHCILIAAILSIVAAPPVLASVEAAAAVAAISAVNAAKTAATNAVSASTPTGEATQDQTQTAAQQAAPEMEQVAAAAETAPLITGPQTDPAQAMAMPAVPLANPIFGIMSSIPVFVAEAGSGVARAQADIRKSLAKSLDRKATAEAAMGENIERLAGGANAAGSSAEAGADVDGAGSDGAAAGDQASADAAGQNASSGVPQEMLDENPQLAQLDEALDQLLSPKPESRRSAGLRDPFAALVSGEMDPSHDGLPSVGELIVVGLIWVGDRYAALAETSDGRSFTLHPGDPLRNGEIIDVAQSGVVVRVNEYGMMRTVTLPIAPGKENHDER